MDKKKRKPIKLPRLNVDWSDTKPPRQHAVYSMLRNLHAAAADAVNTPQKRNKN